MSDSNFIKLRHLMELAKETGLDESEWFLNGLKSLSVRWNENLYQKMLARCRQSDRRHLLNTTFPIPTTKRDIDSVNAELKFAKIAYTDIDFGISRQIINRHGIIIGDTGTGKSTVAKILTSQLINNGGVAVWVIDPKESGDFRFLAKRFQDVIILRPSVLRLNPFSSIPNVPKELLRESVSDVTSDIYGLYEASESIILKNIQRILLQHEQPTFFDFVESFAGEKAKVGGRTQGYLDSIGSRIDKTVISLGNIINCKKDYFSEIYNRNVVFEIGELSGFSQRIIVAWIILSLILYRMRNPGNNLTNLIVFDEAQAQIFPKYESRNRTPTMATVITQARSYGVGVLAMAQNPSKLMNELISNSAFKLSFHLGSGDEVWTMAKSFGLDNEQIQELFHLDAGEAICRLSFGYMDPVLLNIYDFRPEDVNNAELEEMMKPVWAKLLEGIEPARTQKTVENETTQISQPVSQKPSDRLPLAEKTVNTEKIKKEQLNDKSADILRASADLSADEIAYLRILASHPWRLITEVYSILNDEKIMGNSTISQAKAVKIRQKLIQLKLIESFIVNGTGKSGKSQCDILASEIAKTEHPRGGNLHSFWCFRINRYYKEKRS